MLYAIIGWQYAAEHYSNAGIISELIAEGRLSPAARDALTAQEPGQAVSDMLDTMADVECLTPYELQDSEHFPQPVARITIDHDELDDSVCDLVTPGHGSTYTTWRELLNA